MLCSRVVKSSVLGLPPKPPSARDLLAGWAVPGGAGSRGRALHPAPAVSRPRRSEVVGSSPSCCVGANPRKHPGTRRRAGADAAGQGPPSVGCLWWVQHGGCRRPAIAQPCPEASASCPGVTSPGADAQPSRSWQRRFALPSRNAGCLRMGC